MARGDFYDDKPHYPLIFTTGATQQKDADGNTVYDEYNDPVTLPGETFVIEAHVKKLSGQESERLGLDRTRFNLELLCADPMEGDSRIDSGVVSRATLTFMGKAGTVTIEATPVSRLTAVVDALGVKYLGVFDG